MDPQVPSYERVSSEVTAVTPAFTLIPPPLDERPLSALVSKRGVSESSTPV